MAKKAAKSRSTKARKGGAKKRGTSKRDLVSTARNKTFTKRRADGTFKEMDDVGRSLSGDRRTKAKRATKSGYGDQGDRRRAAAKKK